LPQEANESNKIAAIYNLLVFILGKLKSDI
jgi:hypothetical protein